MKKTAILAIMFAAVLCSCSKDNLQENNSGNEQTITAYVNAASKLAFTENEGSGMTSVWEEGDSFYAIQDGQTTVQFTLVGGQGTTSGVFQTTTTGVTETTEWVAVLGNAATVSGTTITCAYLSNQTGKLADLDNNYYIAAKGTGLEPAFDFANGTKMSYIIRVKLPAGVKCVEYTPSAYFTVGADGTPVENTYNSYSSPETNALGADKTGVITLDEVSSAEDTVYINVPAIDYSATRYCRDGKQNGNWVTAVVITVLNGTETDATASNGTIVAEDFSAKGGKIATLDMSSKDLLPRPKPADAVLITNTDASVAVSTNFKQAASVSTCWAPFSIGASSDSEKGNYYSFGEIIANKPLHSFVAYTLRHKPNGTNYDDYMAIKAAKLVDDDLNTQFYTVAHSRYDVARVLWGTSWRLPYAVEAVGLFNKVEKDGTGLKFTGENGNSVHFEPTGFYKSTDNATEVLKEEKYVEFWTADKNNRSQGNAGWNQAIAIYANTEDIKECEYGRYDDYCGLTVRPVLVTSTFAPLAPSYVNPEANAPTYGEDE